MKEKVPVKQALMMCFYGITGGISTELLQKQCGSNLYFWKYLPKENVWRLVVTSTNIKPPAVWTTKELPNEPITPETIYNMEANNSPEQWFAEHTDHSKCVFDRKRYFEYVIHGENA